MKILGMDYFWKIDTNDANVERVGGAESMGGN